MMKNKSTCPLIISLLLVILSACKDNQLQQPSQERRQIGRDILPTTIHNDHDPYFIESSYIDTTDGPKSIVRNIIEDRKGRIWLASWEGIISYDGQTFTNHTNRESLRRYHVFGAMEDKKGQLWFTTIGAGIYKYDGTDFTNYTTTDGLPYDRVAEVYEDPDGILWFGTEEGISRYDGISFQTLIPGSDLDCDDINSIIRDKSGIMWIGTRGKAFYYNDETFTPILREDSMHFYNVRDIMEDAQGRIWLGGNDGLWVFEDNQFTQKSNSFVGYIYEDDKDHLLISTEDKGQWMIHRYSPDGDLIDKIKPETQMLFGIMKDSNGLMWFGSLDGAWIYDGTSISNL